MEQTNASTFSTFLSEERNMGIFMKKYPQEPPITVQPISAKSILIDSAQGWTRVTFCRHNPTRPVLDPTRTDPLEFTKISTRPAKIFNIAVMYNKMPILRFIKNC
jgi:hypothetical protein